MGARELARASLFLATSALVGCSTSAPFAASSMAPKAPLRGTATIHYDRNALVRCYRGKGSALERQAPDKLSARNAGFLAVMSELAYLNTRDETLAAARDLGFTRVEQISLAKAEWAETIEKRFQLIVADSQVVLAENDDAVVVSFRGTQAQVLKDWLTDLDFFKEAMGAKGVQGKVHGGFYRAEALVHDRILEWLAGVKPSKPLFVTGHSLGGALATVFAARYMADYNRFVDRRANDIDYAELWKKPYLQGLYTYGSPRVGDSRFVELFDFLGAKSRISQFEPAMIAPASYSARFIADQDAVSRIPSGSDFAHVHNLKYFDGRGALLEDAQAEKVIVDTLWRLDVARIGEWIADHLMPNTYLEDTYRLANGGASSGCGI
jgi:triacylglycerol lipase